MLGYPPDMIFFLAGVGVGLLALEEPWTLFSCYMQR